ncbi:MAG: hypothetical protein KZQ83_13105 [gamma proteobacterium symbiont of Taylorina sp.]|nr:hypothetical protein [gamma proteobacterium symbiont of Taylorina sp.]
MADAQANNSTLKINDKEYNINDLSNEAKSYIAQIQLIDSKMMPMKAELAVFQTARDTYSNSLNAELEKL